MNKTMWEMYNALIDEIPEDITADEIFVGAEAAYVVSSAGGFGYAGFRDYYQRAPAMTKNMLGLSLKEVASCIKSWNFREASIGHAAICSYYNSRETAEKNGIEILEKKRVEERLKDPFISSQNKVKGKKVAVVGHFPFLESLLGPVCDMSIIEWDPYEGDFPYSAIEYLLPEADFAFLTCAGFSDKTMEHMLDLSQNAEEVTIVGPATPLAPQLFAFGVTDLSGFVVTDNALAARVTAGSENARIFDAGRKVSFKAPGK